MSKWRKNTLFLAPLNLFLALWSILSPTWSLFNHISCKDTMWQHLVSCPRIKLSSSHILEIYILKKGRFTSTFGRACYLPLFRWKQLDTDSHFLSPSPLQGHRDPDLCYPTYTQDEFWVPVRPNQILPQCSALVGLWWSWSKSWWGCFFRESGWGLGLFFKDKSPGCWSWCSLIIFGGSWRSSSSRGAAG